MAYRREPIPPSLSLSLSPSPSFSILTLFLPLPSFNLIFFLAPPLPRSFPTCQPSFSLSLSQPLYTPSSLCSSISFQPVFRALSINGPSVFRVASLSGCSRNNDARVPLGIGRWSHFARVVSVSPTSSLLHSSPLFPNLRSLSRPPSFFFFFVGDHTSACHLSRCVPRYVHDYQHHGKSNSFPLDVIRALLNLGIEFYHRNLSQISASPVSSPFCALQAQERAKRMHPNLP